MKTDWMMVTVVIALALLVTACAKKQQVPMSQESSIAEQPRTAVPSVPVTPSPTSAERTPEDSGLNRPIYFDYDSATLHANSRDDLSRLATSMKRRDELNLTIEGHCDARGATEYNLALGEQRARAARDYLVRLGITPERVDVISYGEERPAVEGADEGAWALNRRDEFVLTRN